MIETPRMIVSFLVDGEPLPKQSYRAVKGGGYTSPRIKAWQDTVALAAREAMQGREPEQGEVAMLVVFVRSNHKRADLDNLNKAVADALRGIVYEDDCQIVTLHLVKHVMTKAKAGILVSVYAGRFLPWFEVKI